MSCIGLEKESFEKICKAVTKIKYTIDNNELNNEVKLVEIKKELKIVEDNL